MGAMTWSSYVLPTYQHTDFEPGSIVLDVGCGEGVQMQELVERGCRAVGVEVSLSQASKVRCDAPVVVARGEALPFAEQAFDGVVSKGVLMLTDEERVIREIARVTRVGGVIDLTVNAAGYYLRYALCSRDVRERVYGLRTLLNTWFKGLTGRSFPGFLGDTVYDSLPRLERLCARHGLQIVRHRGSPTFLGLSVFIYLRLKRSATR